MMNMRQKSSLSLVLALMSAASVVGCSAAGPASLPQGSSGAAGVSNTPEGEEAPTVLVAGVNLTAQCAVLPLDSGSSDAQVLGCLLSSSDDGVELKIGEVTMTVPGMKQKVASTARFGERGELDEGAMRIGKNMPVVFQFDMPKPLVSGLKKARVKLEISTMQEGGSQVPMAVFELKVRRGEIPEECTNSGTKLKLLGTASLDFVTIPSGLSVSTFANEASQTRQGDFDSKGGKAVEIDSNNPPGNKGGARSISEMMRCIYSPNN